MAEMSSMVCPYHGRLHHGQVTTIKTCGKCMEDLGVAAGDSTMLLRESYPGHEPRYRYDCGRCKFAWCCGPQCDCVLKGMQQPPKERRAEVDRAVEMYRQRSR